MKQTVLFTVLLSLGLSLFAQDASVDSTKVFPEAYQGIYKGDLVIKNSRGTQTIPMEIHILPTDTVGRYQYSLVYDGKPRSYSLVVLDATKGLYQIDENNGILLSEKMIDNTLYSIFEVQNNLITTFLTFHEGGAEYLITFSNTKNKETSGGVSEDIPIVYSYPVGGVQMASLKKVKE